MNVGETRLDSRRHSVPRLLYIPDPDARTPLLARVAAAMRGPFEEEVAVLVRLPSRATRELVSLLALIAPMVRAAGASLLISGRADLVLACDLDGVHLPAHGLPPSAARALLGNGPLVGRSCHDASELEAADGADYVTLSPVFAVPGKGTPLGAEAFAALAARARVPVLGLGGVDHESARDLVRLGAHGVAVRRAVDESADPAEELRRFLRAMSARV